MGERGNKENASNTAAMLEMVKTYPTFDVSLSWKGQNTRRENSMLSNPKIRLNHKKSRFTTMRAKRANFTFEFSRKKLINFGIFGAKIQIFAIYKD